MRNNFLCPVFFLAFFLINCEIPSGKLNEVHLYPQNVWGEWIRMDNGNTWYIASNYVKSEDYNALYSYSLAKQSDNVIKLTEVADDSSRKVYYLYASRIPNSSFQASILVNDTVSGTLSAVALNSRAVAAPGGMKAKIPNVNNPANSPQVATNNEGILQVDGIIAGDEYDIIIGNDTARVKPNTGGEDVGTIILINGKGLNFKTSVHSNADDTDMMRLFVNRNYQIKIRIANTGTETAKYSTYTISDADGIIDSGAMTGTLGTIDPGRVYEIPLTVNCAAVSGEFEFKKISIKIKDNSLQNLEWDDSASIKFHKENVDFKIRAMGRMGENGSINGILIVPDGKAYHFTSSGSGSSQDITTVPVPRYAGKDYLIVILGATIVSESSFSFAINEEPGIIPSDFIPNEFYYMYDTENSAKRIQHTDKVMSFLSEDDVSYFRVSFPLGN